MVLSVVVVYVWCFPWGRESRSGVVYFRLASSLPIVTRSRSIASSYSPVHRAIAPSIARSIAGPCRRSLTCLLFQHWESFSWPLPKPAPLCKVSAFRRVGIRAIKSLQKENGKEQWKRNEELWKRQPKVLRLASVDLERSDKNVRFQRQSPKKDAIEKTRSSLLCFGLHTRLEWLPKLTTGNQNLATKTLSESGE